MDIEGENIKNIRQNEERELIVNRTRAAAAYMAIPLVLSFCLVDWFLVTSEVWWRFFFVRSLIIPVSAIGYFSFKSQLIREKYYVLPAHFIATFLGIYSAYLISHTGAETSVYYAGLNLIAFGSIFFLPINRRNLAILFSCIYVPYLFMLLAKESPLDTAYLVPHSAFILSTAFLGFIVNHYARKLLHAEIEARFTLQNEINTKELIIQKKTREGVYLEKLATQFSPQVISAIKNEEFKVTDRIRREVTCIFIDIENSTDRAAKLDHTDYISMMTDFFSDVIEILLQHNVTIGTYLGDGLLAFTNAPQLSDRHPEIAIEACLNLLEKHHQKGRYFKERWRSQFNIRIGINTGYAHIGFFPNERHGTYTALGGTVNLASRLCTKAPPNTICITKYQLKRVAASLPMSFIELVSQNTDIKGFDNEKFELYAIKPIAKAQTKDGEHCPLCNSTLSKEKDFGSVVLMKCTACAYIEPVNKAVA